MLASNEARAGAPAGGPGHSAPAWNRRQWLLGCAGIAAGTLLARAALAAEDPANGAAADLHAAMRRALVEFAGRAQGEGNFPGLSAAVALPDERIVTVTAGWADPERRVPVRPDTRFMSGSTGKTFCAVTALSLVGDRALSLDQPIAAHFAAESWFASLPNARYLTLRMLLNHSAGFHQFLDIASFEETMLWDSLRGRDTGYTPQRMLSFIAGDAPLNAPGAAYHYSDLHYHVVGLLIEKVTGRSYYAVLHERVLARLGLADVLPAASTHLAGLAAGYARGDLLAALAGYTGRSLDRAGDLRKNPALEYTGGGLALTPRALALFYERLFRGEILAPAELQAMLGSTMSVPATPGIDVRYGLGIFIIQRPGYGRYYSHSGFYPGYHSNVGYFADFGFAAAVQVNTDHGPNINELWRDLGRSVIGVLSPATTFA
jgi:D-alanyl-D-alanine carboxypeptidase